jgi:TonB family protein
MPRKLASSPWAVSLLLSLIVHFLLALFFLFSYVPPPLSAPQAIPVVLVPASQLPALETAKKKNRVVADTPSTAKKPLVVTSNQSAAEDQYVKKETIKRGNEKSPPKTQKKKQPLTTKPVLPSSAQSARKISPQKSKTKPLDLNGLFTNKTPDLKKFTTTARPQSPLKNASKTAPFSRAAGSGARFLDDNGGTSDYIPDLPDGDLTLLNAKANRFAVFIRRVALRVFAALRRTGWETLSMNEVQSINQEAIVVVTLTQNGDIKSITINQASGSGAFDRSVQTASKSASDPNPPKAALTANGTVVLEFHARTWARVEPSSRAGMRERRWLYLGTGML